VAWFKKSAPREPMEVTMTGVKLGDRLLAVGVADTDLIALLARRVGLTGRACVVDPDAERVRTAAAAIEKEGALVEVTQAPWGMLPYDDNSFDIAIMRDLLMTMRPDVRVRCLNDIYRVLRPAGRIIVIEPAPRGGIGAYFSQVTMDPYYVKHGGATKAIQAEGFIGARVVGQHEGTIFVEGAKPTPQEPPFAG
jgi:ubiquinone/menaquinone biosynthesis C-methylase UbiE